MWNKGIDELLSAKSSNLMLYLTSNWALLRRTYSIYGYISATVISFIRYERCLLAIGEVAGVRFGGIDPHGLAIAVYSVSDVVWSARAVG